MWGLIKNIILVGLVGLASFPILYLTFMFLAGQLRIEKGPKGPETKEEVQILKYSPIQDSMSIVNSKTYESMLEQEKRLDAIQRQLEKKEERIQLLDRELKEKTEAIERARLDIQAVVKNSEDLEQKRIESLARIYGSMRPEEAATILETLPDELIIAILRAIDEDRQKAKILERMETQRAGRISKLMGADVFSKKTAKQKPDS